MSLSRLLAVARLEFRAGVTGPLFWVLVGGALMLTASINPGALVPSGDASSARAFVNSQHALAQLFALTGMMLYAFLASIMGGMAVIRDDEARVSELLHATPLTAREYIVGKFAGVVALLGVALTVHVLFAIYFFQLAPIDGSAQVRGPFALENFIVPAIAFAAPVILLHAGLAFVVGERTRRPLLVIGVPLLTFLVCVFFLWRWTPSWLNPRIDTALMAIDPSGLRWLSETLFKIDRGVEFYNTRPVAFDATFLVNRAWTVVLPLLAVLSSIDHCRRGIAGESSRRPRRGAREREPRPSAPTGDATVAGPRLDALKMATRPPAFLVGFLQIVRAELRELRAHPALYLFVPLIMLSVWESAASATGALDAPLLMTAGTLAVGALERITFPLCLLLLFYTVESIERDRTTGFLAILHAAPVPTAALLLAKNAATAVVALAILGGCVVAALAFLALQVSRGQGRLELAPLLLVWFVIVPPTLFVWNAFVTAVRAVTGGRYATYAVGIVALLLSVYHHTRPSMTWVHNWNLWTTLRWSDMGVFDLNGRALLLNRLLMVGLGILLTAVAMRFFAREERDSTRTVQRLTPKGIAAAALRLAPFAVLPAVLAGVLAMEVRAGFQSEAVRRWAKNYWSRNVEVWGDAPVPALTHVELRIDLEPAKRSLRAEGAFDMVNDSAVAMERLPFTVGPALEGVAWTVGGRSVEVEERSGLEVLDLPGTLAPGERVRVGFRYRAVLPRGSTSNGGGLAEFILPSGVVLNGTPNTWPVPGFVPGVGVDEENRAEAAPAVAGFWKGTLPPIDGTRSRFTTRLEITAPSEYTVNAVGVRTSRRVDGDRTTVVWESDHPVRLLNVVAGRWEKRQREGTAVFHHPGHAYNVATISDTLFAARRRYSEWFHPYPWRELRISEFPNQVSTAKGFPTNIPFSESSGFLARDDPRTSLAFTVTAHETAHQWWVNLLTPAEAPGADVLIEGMAHYSTLLLQESENGLRGRTEFARRLEAAYGRERRIDAERPLVEVGEPSRPGDRTVVYNKGAWVMWMLHDQLGREAMLAGLQTFIREFKDGPDHPALEDLIETLEPFATDERAYRAFVDQWFRDVVAPEFRISGAVAAGAAGRWRVTATLENIGSGTARVEVAAVRGERFDDAGAPGEDYRESRRSIELLPESPRRLEWELDFEPRRLVVDPDVRVLQLNRDRAVARL